MDGMDGMDGVDRVDGVLKSSLRPFFDVELVLHVGFSVLMW